MGEPYIDPSLKILRHPEILAQMKAGHRPWPVNVEFDLSDMCNLNCGWCAFGDQHRSQTMRPSIAWDLLLELAEGGTQTITFSGGGEPTTNKHFPLVAWNAKALEFDVGLYTNGVDVDPILECLPAFKWIYVSLDEVNESKYREAKGRDCLRQVMNNVSKLVEYRELPDGPVLGIGVLLHPGNVDDIPEAVGVAYGLGVDYIQFRPVVGLDSYADWVPKAKELLTGAKNGWPDFVLASWARFDELVAQENGEYDRGYTVCRGSELVPCIGADGTIWVCPNTRGKRPLGKVDGKTFRDIWLRRPTQMVGPDCRIACRNHNLNRTLEYILSEGPHDGFV